MCALCEKHGRTGTVIGIDPDGFAVESASATTPSTAHCTVEFVQGKAQDLHQLLAGKIPTDGVDYVSIHDALHEIDEADKQDVIRSMVDVLRPGGLFSYNSAFTTIAMDECPMVWGRIKSKAISILGGKRDRNAQGFVVHTPEEYRQMLVDAGLAVIHEARRSVMMSRAALEAIARYPQFAFGVFVDMVDTEQVSIQQKSQAIIQAIHELGVTESLRIWHEIVAQKPARA